MGGMRIAVQEHSRMDLFDFIKATIVCGLVAFLCYTFPVIGQAAVIGVLALVWLAYARKLLITLRSRHS
jgi:hypothetical protein